MNEFEGQWYDFGGGEECGEVEWASSDLSSELTTIIGPSVAIEEEIRAFLEHCTFGRAVSQWRLCERDTLREGCDWSVIV